MIEQIIHTYLELLLAIGVGAVFVFIVGLYFIFQHRDHDKHATTAKQTADIDFHSIAGDDVIATKLDLARAYIETGNKQMAQSILNLIIAHGSKQQQQEARSLLSS